MSSRSACRLYVYLASEAPIGVVLRRGPSHWVRLSIWHTDTDVIEHGQWLRGRVYERRCDLSPDGSLWIYFAHKATAIHDIGVDSWAAICRPPWFTALALWGVGTTYFTGGLFLASDRVLLGGICDAPDRGQVPGWLRLTADGLTYVDRSREWANRTVHYNRLLRSGWVPSHTVIDDTTLWERQQPGGTVKLIMAPHLKTSLSSTGTATETEYAVAEGQQFRELGVATWADWDQQGRLVMAQEGCLVQMTPSGQRREIEDFNPHRPDPQPAPLWAITWPKRDRTGAGR